MPLNDGTGQSTPWTTFACALDGGLGERVSIGLLALSVDGIIEHELRRFLPLAGVSIYTTRIGQTGETTPDALKKLEDEIPQAAAMLLPGRKLDVIAFGCTSGAMTIGSEAVASRIRHIRPDTPVVDPVAASLKAFAHLGIRRVGLLTPYIDSVNEIVRAYFTEHNLHIGAQGSFKQLPPSINRIAESDVYNAAVALGQLDVDGVFISCTGLRCSSVLQSIEDAIGKPVVASNQALAWDILRSAGIDDRIDGFGRLLSS